MQRHKFREWIQAGEWAIEHAPDLPETSETHLPPIVQLYLRKVLPQAPARVHHVRFEQTGFMALRPGPVDKAFSAQQIMAVGQPAFSWTAQIAMMPLLKVQVCDRLVGQEGFLQARLAGMIPLAHESGPALLKGELLRYLAELPWAPWGFLHLQQADWKEVKPRLWQLTLHRAEGDIRIRYAFDEQTLIRSIDVDDRPRSVGKGRSEPTAWQGEFADYTDFQGILIPRHAEVCWWLKGGAERFTYFKAQIESYTVF